MASHLSVTDQRAAIRHPVDYNVIADYFDRGDVPFHVSNVSANGFMIDNAEGGSRGDRVIVSFPVIGRIEAYLIWTKDNRAGFQFERIIRVDDFLVMIDELQPNPRLRRRH
ncbi:PilZ domain-containing protein [Citromicrobium bathyomarinum]|uniref:PilZ domain-containing protein n=1 Tax=Citromicrobium bathyomarinum TaxID=72174 RepID=UPI00315A8E73